VEGSHARSVSKWRMHVILVVVSFRLGVTVKLDSYIGTSHSEHVTNVIIYPTCTEKRYSLMFMSFSNPRVVTFLCFASCGNLPFNNTRTRIRR